MRVSFAVLCLANMAVGFLMPPPSARYNVTLTTGPLVDYTRTDPMTGDPRALMLSVFQPALCPHTGSVPYMPNKTAEFQGPYLQKTYNISANLSPLFLAAQLPVCTEDYSLLNDRPILLFSPGYGISRLYYSVIASAIASEGFMVMTIDHPGDTNIITYPDGHSVESGVDPSVFNRTAATAAEAVRVADASFIVDQFNNATAMRQLLPQRGPLPLPTDHVAMFGHSLGGAASMAVLGQDRRFRAGIVWDGTAFIQPPSNGTSQPVLFMARQQNATDSTWMSAWPFLKGPKLIAQVANSTHFSFSDGPTLFQAAGADSTPFAQLLGTIAPREMVRILAAYTKAWMNGALEGKEGGNLLEGKDQSKYPEVSNVMKGNF